MSHFYRKKALTFLIVMLAIFLLLFIYAYTQYSRGIGIFDIGLSSTIEDMIVMLFCIAGMARVVYELFMIESHIEYQKRIDKKSMPTNK